MAQWSFENRKPMSSSSSFSPICSVSKSSLLLSGCRRFYLNLEGLNWSDGLGHSVLKCCWGYCRTQVLVLIFTYVDNEDEIYVFCYTNYSICPFLLARFDSRIFHGWKKHQKKYLFSWYMLYLLHDQTLSKYLGEKYSKNNSLQNLWNVIF